MEKITPRFLKESEQLQDDLLFFFIEDKKREMNEKLTIWQKSIVRVIKRKAKSVIKAVKKGESYKDIYRFNRLQFLYRILATHHKSLNISKSETVIGRDVYGEPIYSGRCHYHYKNGDTIR